MGPRTGIKFPIRANLAVGFTPYKGMTKTLSSLLISAVLGMRAFAQVKAPHYNSFLDEAFFPKLKTDEQVAELVRKAGFTPVSQVFVAKLPTGEMNVKFTLSDDGNDLVLVLNLGALANEQAKHIDQMLSQFEGARPSQMKFRSFLYTRRISQDSVALALLVLIPNRGTTPAELKQAVSELAQTAGATELIWRLWIKR
jgi:hypothetical protein